MITAAIGSLLMILCMGITACGIYDIVEHASGKEINDALFNNPLIGQISLGCGIFGFFLGFLMILKADYEEHTD